jgi:hypothetical protein
MTTVEQLAERFINLIIERDLTVAIFDCGYDERCQEIDDKLIPEIIGKIPKKEMDQFNELVNNPAAYERLTKKD